MTRLTGGQATNTSLMELFSKVCNIPVILPHSNSAAVVVGSAMLGRFAAEVATECGYVPLETQEKVEKASHNHRERLWEIMVRISFLPHITPVPCSVPDAAVLRYLGRWT
jgi:D-ribulokinase